MKKTSNLRLALSTETIRVLNGRDAARVRGGVLRSSHCSVTDWCDPPYTFAGECETDTQDTTSALNCISFFCQPQ